MLWITFYLVCYTLPQIALSILQYRHIKQNMQQKAVILPEDQYKQAGFYALACERLKIYESLLDALVMFVALAYVLVYLQTLWSLDSLWQEALYVLLVLLVSHIVRMPLSVYKTFVIDKQYGFFKGTWQLFISDQLKSLALFFVIGYLLLVAVLFIFENLTHWWIYASAFFFAVVVITNVVYPIFIAPFFNRFTPLEEGELKEKIDSLMERVGFKANGIFIVDASKRDGRLNAYFGGLGQSKRVVLFDTLVSKVSNTQLLAILGHELGHFKHHDLYKGLAFSLFVITGIFFVMAHIPMSVFEDLGLYATSYNHLLLIVMFSSVMTFWVMPLMGMMSRYNEYQADAFGAALESKEALREALLVLVNENKSFPSSHPLYIAFYHTHPPLLERLKALGYDHS